jgi:hypothetical protein
VWQHLPVFDGGMNSDESWQIVLVLATGAAGLWFLVRSLRRYRGR